MIKYKKIIWVFLFIMIYPFVVTSQTITKNIIIDQFGYRPSDKKIAVIRNPQRGYDADNQYVPGTSFQVVNSDSKDVVYESSIEEANIDYSTDAYGDKVWWFDFSTVQEEGTYYVFDKDKNLRSYIFRIDTAIYNSVLSDAVRMLFFQRAGCEKAEIYTGVGFSDKASHLRSFQDKNCRLYSSPNDSKTERDLSGGWYDAGDYNKYTVWACNNIEVLLYAYKENPQAWLDNYNIPESGNGIADVLDEIKWGMDWVLRMQEDDGSVLSIVGLDAASPPSSATGESLYGPATTNATYAAAKVFAAGALVFKTINATYSSTLQTAALKAWAWAEANPTVEFYNAENEVGAGEQESSSTGRIVLRLNAALYLFELTGETTYLNVFEKNYTNLDFFKWSNHMDQYRQQDQSMLLRYISLPNVTTSVKNAIKNALKTAFLKSGNYIDMVSTDAYRSYIDSYNWGSNSYKCDYGTMFYMFQNKNIISDVSETYQDIALDYLHYIHGVNPFAMVWLTNMNERGASNSVNQMYHSWFCDGSSLWDDVKTSEYGPAPGFLIGGSYSGYTWDDCCPNTCGSEGNNSLCNSSYLFADDEPDAKKYNDFNDSWPLNSWSITEPSCGYQVNYIRLISKFVTTDGIVNADKQINVANNGIEVYPNPTTDQITITTENTDNKIIRVFDIQSRQIIAVDTDKSQITLNLKEVPSGVYMLQVFNRSNVFVKQIIKN